MKQAAQGGSLMRRRDSQIMIKGIILTTLLCFKVYAAGPAGVKLDGSIGAAAQVLAGPTYNITQNLGKLAGGNLFFSFQYFNIATGQTALYTTTSPGINNVISRVTGGDASTIDGTISLQAAYGAPNFFLINPAGVTFTANAQVNVPASFHVTTADYLKFGDGNFYSDPTKPSTLSAAAPEAFGFLGATRSPVNVLGATLSGGNNGMGDFQIVAGDGDIEVVLERKGDGIVQRQVELAVVHQLVDARGIRQVRRSQVSRRVRANWIRKVRHRFGIIQYRNRPRLRRVLRNGRCGRCGRGGILAPTSDSQRSE